EPRPAYHSAVHSQRLPIMSCAPHTLTHKLSASFTPVFRFLPALVTQRPMAPSSAPGSAVPVAASSHSGPVGRRLPLARHARLAWNHDRLSLGGTPFLLTA